MESLLCGSNLKIEPQTLRLFEVEIISDGSISEIEPLIDCSFTAETHLCGSILQIEPQIDCLFTTKTPANGSNLEIEPLVWLVLTKKSVVCVMEPAILTVFAGFLMAGAAWLKVSGLILNQNGGSWIK